MQNRFQKRNLFSLQFSEIQARINQEDNTLIVLKNPDCQISDEIKFDLYEIAPHVKII